MTHHDSRRVYQQDATRSRRTKARMFALTVQVGAYDSAQLGLELELGQ